MKRRPIKLSGMQGWTLPLCLLLGVSIVVTFGQDGDPITQEVRDLERKLMSHDGSERAATAWPLGEIGARASSAAHALRLALGDTFPEARINAIMAHRTITVEQTGGLVDSTSYAIEGSGGLLEVGDRVLLFLKAQDESSYYYISHPIGRYAIDNDDTLQAVAPDNAVAAGLDSRPVAVAINIIETAG